MSGAKPYYRAAIAADLCRKLRWGSGGYRAFALKPGERQAITAANAGFFENMFQMNLDRAGLDAEHLGDIAIAKPLFDQSHDFAQMLGIQTGTVKIHLKHIFE